MPSERFKNQGRSRYPPFLQFALPSDGAEIALYSAIIAKLALNTCVRYIGKLFIDQLKGFSMISSLSQSPTSIYSQSPKAGSSFPSHFSGKFATMKKEIDGYLLELESPNSVKKSNEWIKSQQGQKHIPMRTKAASWTNDNHRRLLVYLYDKGLYKNKLIGAIFDLKDSGVPAVVTKAKEHLAKDSVTMKIKTALQCSGHLDKVKMALKEIGWLASKGKFKSLDFENKTDVFKQIKRKLNKDYSLSTHSDKNPNNSNLLEKYKNVRQGIDLLEEVLNLDNSTDIKSSQSNPLYIKSK
jgi:hypothetical protein